MNALSIVNKVVSLVSYKMHKTRLNAVTACVKSLLNGSAATVTSIGRGINTKAFEKHRIKRADRLLSNQNLLSETPLIYSSIHLYANYFAATQLALLSQSTGQI